MKPTFQLTSPQNQTAYWIYTHVPPPEVPGPWTAVAFLDGDDQFAPAVAAYEEQRRAGSVPPLLLIGVGYGASYTRPGNRRGRDYTPVAHADEPSSGGADAFLAFLTATLWPELARRYPVHPGQRGVAGHSLGALLVLQALFQPQPFFTHHLASAPSVWWAERAMLDHVRRLRANQDALAAQVYLAVGEDDTPSMTGDLTLLEQQLAQAPFRGLAVTTQRLAGRDHYNSLPDAFAAGLRTLFGVRER